MRIVGLINARGGSKGIPRKNIYSFANKPLIAHSIELALKTIGEIYVSTDDDEIANIAREYGAKIIKRPDELAQDDSIQVHVTKHAQETIQADILVLLQPTSPLRTANTIERALRKLKGFDSLMSYYEDDFKAVFVDKDGCLQNAGDPWDDNNRQLIKTRYREAGTIYIYRKEFLKTDNIYGERVAPFLVNKKESLDIDYLEDLFIAEAVFEKSNNCL